MSKLKITEKKISSEGYLSKARASGYATLWGKRSNIGLTKGQALLMHSRCPREEAHNLQPAKDLYLKRLKGYK